MPQKNCIRRNKHRLLKVYGADGKRHTPANIEQLEKGLKVAKAAEKANDKEADEAWTKMKCLVVCMYVLSGLHIHGASSWYVQLGRIATGLDS